LKTLVALVGDISKRKKNVKIIGSEDLEGDFKQKDNPTTPLHMRQSCYNYRICLDNTAEKVF
jgi:hypothetical protein